MISFVGKKALFAAFAVLVVPATNHLVDPHIYFPRFGFAALQFELTCHTIAFYISAIERSLKVLGYTNMFSSTNASFPAAARKVRFIIFLAVFPLMSIKKLHRSDNLLFAQRIESVT